VRLTRRQLAAAGLGAGIAATGAAPARAAAASGLELLLSYEHRLADAYRAALSHGVIEEALGTNLLAQEREHVRGVELALEGRGPRRPLATVPRPGQRSALSGARAFARYALALESQTTAAYVRVLATLDAPGLRQPLGSIMASGAQHQVALRNLLGEPLLRGVA
jgi:Ferritin-like domain